MKKKIFISLIISLCLVLGNTTVFAENSLSENEFSSDEYYDEYVYDTEHINDDEPYDENIEISEIDEYELLFNENTLYEDRAYFLDAAGKISDDAENQIYQNIIETANDTQNGIAVYIGSEKRDEQAINEFSSWGLDCIFFGDSLQNGEIYAFIYFDVQSGSDIKISLKSTCSPDDSRSTILDNLLKEMQSIADGYTNTGINYTERVLVSCMNTFLSGFSKIENSAVQTSEESYNTNSYKKYYSAYAPTTYYQFDYYKDNTVYYCDESERFTKEQKQKIIDLLKDTSAKIGFNLAVYTGGYNRTDQATETFTQNGAMDIFGLDTPNGTVFLYLDTDGLDSPGESCDSMYCYHQPFLYYTSEIFGNRIERILSAMADKLPAGGEEILFDDIYAALTEYCNQLIKYKGKGMEEGCYYYDSAIQKYIVVRGGKAVQTNMVNWQLPLIIALVLGFIAFISVYFGIKQEYKFKSSAGVSAYTSGNSTNLNVKNDIFLGSHITKTYIERSSGSHGSHHSGGSFHGGGHSGGGGGSHHR